MRKILGFIAVLPLAWAPLAAAKSLLCNHDQTRCLTESTDLTIGDQVGIFNEENELVATGEVKAMRGERRAVLINNRHGTIRKGYRLSILETPASDSAKMSETYKVYREPATLAVGASLGYSSVSIGEGTVGSEMSAYAQWRKWGGLQLIARGVYTSLEGQLLHEGDIDSETLPVSAKGLGLLGGVGYIVRENKPISFRGEAAAGMMQVQATVGGDSALVDSGETNAKVKNGISPYGRWSLGVMWNLASWHMHADFAESLVSQAFANTLALGISKDMQ